MTTQDPRAEKLRVAIEMMIDSGAVSRLYQEMAQAHEKFGPYNTPHELYAVLQEEVDEYWNSVKENRPDAFELLQVAAVAFRGYLQLTEG